MTPDPNRAAIAAMGRALGPDMLARVHDLYRAEQAPFVAEQPAAVADAPYGPDERQRLDLYMPVGNGRPAPVLLWVHGGGFLRGDKCSPDHPYNAHAGRWAARNGMLGAVMNYRLAPRHGWPAGGEDVGLAVDWLRAHARDHNGDPEWIILIGTSAGAVHVATHFRLRPDPGVRGAVLLSGLYGFTPLDERDTLYYGPAGRYPERWPREAVVETALPLLLAAAEHDPPRFQREWTDLLSARLDRHGVLPRNMFAVCHNHFSLAYHLGGRDTRLADAILDFIGDLS